MMVDYCPVTFSDLAGLRLDFFLSLGAEPS